MNEAPSGFAPWLGVFETLRVSEGIPLFVPQHMAEFRHAATALGLNVSSDFTKLQAQLPKASGRWRWIATTESTRAFFVEEKITPVEPIEISISTLRLGSQNWDARFKTLSYLTHAQAIAMAATPEVVLTNEHGHIASAARANIFWRRGERLFTPAHETGCRCGIVRGFVLQAREVEEGDFEMEDLLGSDEIFITNSMRGIVSVRAVEGRPWDSFDAADALRTEYSAEIVRQLAHAQQSS